MSKLNGKTLLEHVIDQVRKSRLVNQVIVSTDSLEIIKYAGKYKNDSDVKVHRRPITLSSYTTTVDEVALTLIDEMSIKCETLTFLSVEYPYRETFYIDKAIRLMYLFDTDSVISVKTLESNIYQHDGHGLKPLPGNRRLRIDRETLYIEAGGIHTCKFESLCRNRAILGKTVAHIEVDALCSTSVNNPLVSKTLNK